MQKLFLILLLVCLIVIAIPIVALHRVPRQNTDADRFDALIVLGIPASLDGTSTPEMRQRVDESIREYRRGIATHIIFTGTSAHNRFVEAQVMADYAVSQGVPRSALIVEDRAKDTIQNIWYSREIMQAHGWTSAEVISSPYHLPRTAMILRHYTGPNAFPWRTHAAPWPAHHSAWKKFVSALHEVAGYYLLRVRESTGSPFLPS